MAAHPPTQEMGKAHESGKLPMTDAPTADNGAGHRRLSVLRDLLFSRRIRSERRRACCVWNPPEGAGRDTHICLQPKRHAGNHRCKCGDEWSTRVIPTKGATMLSDMARAFRNAWAQMTGKRERQKMTWPEFSEGWASLPTREKVIWTAMYVAAITLFCWLFLTLFGIGPW